MPSHFTRKTGRVPRGLRALFGIAILCFFILGAGDVCAAAAKQKTFASADDAVTALVDALKAGSGKELTAVLGPDGKDILSSGDPVQDKADRDKFLGLYAEKRRLDEAGPGKMALYVGNNDWPFPVPIVRAGKAWRFDAKAIWLPSGE